MHLKKLVPHDLGHFLEWTHCPKNCPLNTLTLHLLSDTRSLIILHCVIFFGLHCGGYYFKEVWLQFFCNNFKLVDSNIEGLVRNIILCFTLVKERMMINITGCQQLITYSLELFENNSNYLFNCSSPIVHVLVTMVLIVKVGLTSVFWSFSSKVYKVNNRENYLLSLLLQTINQQ